MNICSHQHEEVCFEGRRCPMCELIKEHEGELSELRQEVKSLSDQLAAATNEIEMMINEPVIAPLRKARGE